MEKITPEERWNKLKEFEAQNKGKGVTIADANALMRSLGIAPLGFGDNRMTEDEADEYCDECNLHESQCDCFEEE